MMCFSRSTPDHSADHVDDENHDFFSGSGSSYMIGKALNPEDVDWDLKSVHEVAVYRQRIPKF